MRIATRLFLGASLLVAATVIGLVVAIDSLLRDRLETEIAAGLARDAGLLAALLPPDSTRWPELARTLGEAAGRRITLVAPDGQVRGDTEFDRAALPHLENHGSRPEIRAALAGGVGVDRRRSASNNEPQMYVAVRGGPPGLAAVRVSASLRAVDAQVHAVQAAVAWAGILAVLAAAILAWPLSAAVARPLNQLSTAARRIAAGEPPEFPDSRIPEIAEHGAALLGMATQLAERFQALQAEQRDARTLVDSLQDGIIAADARGEIVTCNAAARRLLGYQDVDRLPPLGELFHDKRARDLLSAAFAGREVEQQELRLEDRELLVTARTLPAGGVLLSLRDVTAIRRLEAVRRDFVANVSHELKTPLTSIAGYAETLTAEPALDPQARKFADTILSNARRMQHLVDELLDLSRIESGGWQPQRRAVEIEPVIRESWAAVTAQTAGRELHLEVAVASSAQTLVADPAALRQILTNLLENAVRHTPAGGRIRVAAQAAPAGIMLSVSDTGSGIAPEHVARIFERFYRVDAGRSRDRGGTGLGLAIVKHLVEAHGGRIEAETALGHGTTIQMTFPPEPAGP